MPDECRRYGWQMALRLFRPDAEHLLCLILFCLLSILGFVFWTYEDGLGILGGRWSDGRRQLQSDIYDAALEDFLRDERRLKEERAVMFPEFPEPDEDAPDVLKRHRESHGQEVASEKSERVLKKINRDFKSQRKKKRRSKKYKRMNSTKGGVEPLKGGEAFCKVYDTKPDVDEDFECIPLKFMPPVEVMTYHFYVVSVW